MWLFWLEHPQLSICCSTPWAHKPPSVLRSLSLASESRSQIQHKLTRCHGIHHVFSAMGKRKDGPEKNGVNQRRADEPHWSLPITESLHGTHTTGPLMNKPPCISYSAWAASPDNGQNAHYIWRSHDTACGLHGKFLPGVFCILNCLFILNCEIFPRNKHDGYLIKE